MKCKALNKMTFEELVEEATQQIHLALIKGGGKDMTSMIYIYMEKAIRWNIEQPKNKL